MNTYLEMIADTAEYSFSDKIFLAYFEPEVLDVVREWLYWSADQYEMQTGADPTLELLVERATMQLVRRIHTMLDEQLVAIKASPYNWHCINYKDRTRAFITDAVINHMTSVNCVLIIRKCIADEIEQDDRYQLNVTENDVEYITYRRD